MERKKLWKKGERLVKLIATGANVGRLQARMLINETDFVLIITKYEYWIKMPIYLSLSTVKYYLFSQYN